MYSGISSGVTIFFFDVVVVVVDASFETAETGSTNTNKAHLNSSKSKSNDAVIFSSSAANEEEFSYVIDALRALPMRPPLEPPPPLAVVRFVDVAAPVVVCEKDEFREQQQWPALSQPTGIHNSTGSCCYLNSALQCLAALPGLACWCASG